MWSYGAGLGGGWKVNVTSVSLVALACLLSFLLFFFLLGGCWFDVMPLGGLITTPEMRRRDEWGVGYGKRDTRGAK